MKKLLITKQVMLSIVSCIFTVGLLPTYTHAFQLIANAVAVDNNMNILAAGENSSLFDGSGPGLLARYLPLGDLDTSFGTGGIATILIGKSTSFFSIALQSDNKIIAAGQVRPFSTLPISVVLRFNTDGSLDTTFGISGVAAAPTSVNGSMFSSVQIQSDGKIVATGPVVIDGNSQVFIVRFNTDGSVDTSFGTNGVITTQVGFVSAAYALVIQDDGSLVVGGISQSDGPGQLMIARYDSSGDPDLSFGTNGITISPISDVFCTITGLALQDDGSIVACGSIYNDDGTINFLVVRYTSGGILDTSFNGTGFVQLSIDSFSSANALFIQDDGQIVATGSSSGSTNGVFATARFNTDGSLDTSFGTNGIATTALNINGQGDTSNALAFQLGTSLVDGFVVVNNGIIVAGSSDINFGLIRYHVSDGTIDTDFGTDGIVTVPAGSF